MTGKRRCLGQKAPEAPSSAVKPCTVLTGSKRPLRTDSSKLPSRAPEVGDQEGFGVGRVDRGEGGDSTSGEA